MKNLLLILLLIFISGCEGIKVKKYGTGVGRLTVPSTEFSEIQMKARAEQECKVQNMVLSSISLNERGDGQPFDNTFMGYKFYDFFCESPPDPVQLNPVRTEQKEIKNEPSQAQTKITIEEAKDKCKTLGFKSGTEKFGSCVLELTK